MYGAELTTPEELRIRDLVNQLQAHRWLPSLEAQEEATEQGARVSRLAQ